MKVPKQNAKNQRSLQEIKSRRSWTGNRNKLSFRLPNISNLDRFYKIGAEVVSQKVAITEVKRENAEGSKSQAVSLPLLEITRRIQILESSGGKNDGCRRYGKFNGYGYRQNSKEWKCFDSEGEVEGYVSELFEKRLETMTLEESLCLYNRGIKTSNCEYANKFNSI